MYIRLYSDLHYELLPKDYSQISYNFTNFVIPKLETDSETILILAGDITSSLQNIVNFIENILTYDFKHIVYVFGNHEYYNSTTDVVNEVKNKFKNEKRLSILNNDYVIIDNMLIIGATLWTDFDKGNPFIMNIIKDSLNDYRKIKMTTLTYPKHITPYYIYSQHTKSKDYIFSTLENQFCKNNELKKIVVTHHAPSELSISDKYKQCKSDIEINFGFFSELFETIYNSCIDYWFHGHTHYPSNYLINNCKVIANPKGYGDENNLFNEKLLIKI